MASAYSVYQGSIGTWYSHTMKTCHKMDTHPHVPAPGDRTWSGYTTGSTSHPGVYFLVNAANPATEGVLGQSSGGALTALPPSSCGPTP